MFEDPVPLIWILLGFVAGGGLVYSVLRWGDDNSATIESLKAQLELAQESARDGEARLKALADEGREDS